MGWGAGPIGSLKPKLKSMSDPLIHSSRGDPSDYICYSNLLFLSREPDQADQTHPITLY